MSERHTHYRDLAREKRHEILHSLATLAIDIVTRHPNILERSLLEVMVYRHEYGYVAVLGLHLAVKSGSITADDDGYNRFYKLAIDTE